MRRFAKKIIRPLGIRYLLAREWLETRVTFNPTSTHFAMDPYHTYALLMKRDPVHWSRLTRFWIVSSYRDVDSVLRDHKRFVNDVRNTGDQITEEQAAETHSMLYLDPPDHTRLRSLVSQAFMKGSIESMYSRVEQIVDDLLERLDGRRQFDLIDDLAYPLPITVISEILGIPSEDQGRFKEWSDHVASALEPGLSEGELREVNESMDALSNYFDGIANQRRAQPEDDLITALAAAEEDGRKLTHQELLVTLTLLLVAGNETTKNLIGNGMLALLRHPEQLARLREAPELIPSAVEELLRYDSPVQIDTRTASEDLDVGGRHIKRGERVAVLIGSANRDSEAFSQPGSLLVGRDERSHMSFGRGIHHCLGSALALVEGQVAIRKLLQRYPDIRLAGKPKPNHRVVLRGLRKLPVEVAYR